MEQATVKRMRFARAAVATTGPPQPTDLRAVFFGLIRARRHPGLEGMSGQDDRCKKRTVVAGHHVSRVR